METITSNETSLSNAEKAINSKWSFSKMVKRLFRTKQLIEKNTDDNHKISGELLEQVSIHDTPFTAVKFGKNWFLCLGKYRLTNQLGSLDECKAEAKDASWIRIMQIIKIVIQDHEEQKQLNETIAKQTKQN